MYCQKVKVNKDMIYFIAGILFNVLLWLLLRLFVERSFKYNWAWGILLSFIVSIFCSITVSTYYVEEKVEATEIVSVNGQYFDEYTDEENHKCVNVYHKGRNNKIEKKSYRWGINEIKYEGNKAFVEYVIYDTKDSSLLEDTMLFPTTYLAKTYKSTEGVTIIIPENEVK